MKKAKNVFKPLNQNYFNSPKSNAALDFCKELDYVSDTEKNKDIQSINYSKKHSNILLTILLT